MMTKTTRLLLAHAGVAMVGAASVLAQNEPPAQPAQPDPIAPAAQPVVPVPLNVPEGPKWSSPEIAKVGDMLKGAWKTTEAVTARDGSPSGEVVLVITPIRTKDIPDAMYVESFRVDAPQAPYRRALYQLYAYKGKVRLRTFETSTVEGRDALNELTGFWAAPEFLPLLTSNLVKRADFLATLDIDLEPFKQGGGFAGKTPYPYPNGADGAVEMTSELQIQPDVLTTSDRGFGSDGKVVWGQGEKDKYTFTRYKPEFPMVDRREGDLVLLWYRKVVEGGAVLDESQRYYAHYTGWQAGGPLLDTSRTRIKPGGPFGLKQIPQIALGTIQGWKQALRGVGVGSRVRMLVPGHLAYGKNPPTRDGRQVVGPDTPLIFEIEMVGLEPAEKPKPEPLPQDLKLIPNRPGGAGGPGVGGPGGGGGGGGQGPGGAPK